MVVVALVQAIQQILNKHALDVPAEQSELALLTALGRLSLVDWRSDMAIVQLIHNHPIKAAVEPFIRLMRQSRGEVDPILKIINKNASRFLGLEAHRALKRITGAVIPDDPAKWEEFWAKTQDEIVVKRRGPADRTKTFAQRDEGSFYGIPVLGNEVVFVIDTSGSMKERVKPKPGRPKTGRSAPRMSGTRLSVAKRQTLKAIQGMSKHAKFSIVTFHSTVTIWNNKPVSARSSARHRSGSILAKLKPKGGTNVFDALIHVLEGRNVGYGSKPSSNVDEVFVLSDGQPSSGVLTDTAEILRVVGEVNKLRKIRIHAVYAGEGSGADFMRTLAEQNGGVFVQQ
jgi:Mg-chelatase subunit ChlD